MEGEDELEATIAWINAFPSSSLVDYELEHERSTSTVESLLERDLVVRNILFAAQDICCPARSSLYAAVGCGNDISGCQPEELWEQIWRVLHVSSAAFIEKDNTNILTPHLHKTNEKLGASLPGRTKMLCELLLRATVGSNTRESVRSENIQRILQLEDRHQRALKRIIERHNIPEVYLNCNVISPSTPTAADEKHDDGEGHEVKLSPGEMNHVTPEVIVNSGDFTPGPKITSDTLSRTNGTGSSGKKTTFSGSKTSSNTITSFLEGSYNGGHTETAAYTSNTFSSPFSPFFHVRHEQTGPVSTVSLDPGLRRKDESEGKVTELASSSPGGTLSPVLLSSSGSPFQYFGNGSPARRRLDFGTCTENRECESSLKKRITYLEALARSKTERELYLESELETVTSRNRSREMRMEAEAIDRQNELRSDAEAVRRTLRETLTKNESYLAELQRSRDEMAALRDELDVLRPMQMSLEKTEEQLEKCRKRLEEANLSKANVSKLELMYESEISKIVILEEEIKSLQPLKKQLHDARNRANDVEMELVLCQEKLVATRKDYHSLLWHSREVETACDELSKENQHLTRKLAEQTNVNIEEVMSGKQQLVPGKRIPYTVSSKKEDIGEYLERLSTEHQLKDLQQYTQEIERQLKENQVQMINVTSERDSLKQEKEKLEEGKEKDKKAVKYLEGGLETSNADAIATPGNDTENHALKLQLLDTVRYVKMMESELNACREKLANTEVGLNLVEEQKQQMKAELEESRKVRKTLEQILDEQTKSHVKEQEEALAAACSLEEELQRLRLPNIQFLCAQEQTEDNLERKLAGCKEELGHVTKEITAVQDQNKELEVAFKDGKKENRHLRRRLVERVNASYAMNNIKLSGAAEEALSSKRTLCSTSDILTGSDASASCIATRDNDVDSLSEMESESNIAACSAEQLREKLEEAYRLAEGYKNQLRRLQLQFGPKIQIDIGNTSPSKELTPVERRFSNKETSFGTNLQDNGEHSMVAHSNMTKDYRGKQQRDNVNGSHEHDNSNVYASFATKENGGQAEHAQRSHSINLVHFAGDIEAILESDKSDGEETEVDEEYCCCLIGGKEE